MRRSTFAGLTGPASLRGADYATQRPLGPNPGANRFEADLARKRICNLGLRRLVGPEQLSGEPARFFIAREYPGSRDQLIFEHAEPSCLEKRPRALVEEVAVVFIGFVRATNPLRNRAGAVPSATSAITSRPSCRSNRRISRKIRSRSGS